METEKIKQLISNYAAAIDAVDTEQAEKFLDPEFRVVLNNYKNSGVTSCLSKTVYLDMIRNGQAGGKPRVLRFLLIDEHADAAVAKVTLTGDQSAFTNYYNLVRKNDQWSIVNDIPQIINL